MILDGNTAGFSCTLRSTHDWIIVRIVSQDNYAASLGRSRSTFGASDSSERER